VFYQQWSEALRKRCTARSPLTVGVFVNCEKEEIVRIVKLTGIDLIQLHGEEGFDGFDLVSMQGTPCIRVLHIQQQHATNKDNNNNNNSKNNNNSNNNNNNNTAINASANKSVDTTKTMEELVGCSVPVDGPCCALLLDTKVTASSGTVESGGTGVAFDWSVARQVKEIGYPVIVAGGLNPTNVNEALNMSGAFCVDVSSGVENKETGYKDHAMVKAFVRNAKSVGSVE